MQIGESVNIDFNYKGTWYYIADEVNYYNRSMLGDEIRDPIWDIVNMLNPGLRRILRG